MVPAPAFAVTVPLHVLLTLGVLATASIPVVEGRGSLKVTPVKSPAAVRFGLVIVRVSVDVAFSGMLTAGLKALLIVGGATTVILVFDVLPVPPSVDVI